MKNFKYGVAGKLLLSLILVLGSRASAANPTTLKGVVTDLTNGEPLPFANVFIEGTGLGTAADEDGVYIITNIPPGNYSITATYLGYQDKVIKTVLEGGKTVVLNFALSYEAVKGETIVVTAQAEGQMQAINQQLSSRQIKNVVSADRIQELPDANAAESVGRLPGVSIVRSGGEGNKVVIRGLSPKYNRVMVDGVQMASTDFDDRSSDLSMISPYMLDGIEVLKAITPDQDADALGGTVNFKMKEARDKPDGVFGYDVIARGGYNDLKSAVTDYKFVGEISKRLIDNRLGILAQVDIEQRNRSSQEMGSSYDHIGGAVLGEDNPVRAVNLNLYDIPRERMRLGATLVLDYRIPDGTINFKNFYSSGKTDVTNFGESFNIIGDSHQYSATDTRSDLTVMTNILNYEQRFSNWKIDAKLSHSRSENNSPKNMRFNFVERDAFYEIPGGSSIDPTRIPSFAKDSLLNTKLTTIAEYEKKSVDMGLTASFNAEMDYNISKTISGKLKLGGKYQYKDRTFDQNQYDGNLSLGSGQLTRNAILDAFPWMKETVQDGSSNLPYTLFLNNDYSTKSFINGDYTLGPTADIGLLYQVLDVIREIHEPGAYDWNDYLSTTNDYKGNEYISAGYIMTDINFGQDFKIIPGVRYEYAKTSYTGARGSSGYLDYKQNYRHKDTTAVQTNAYWLPMVHVRYHPLEWLDVRFAYTNTLSRPDYRQLIPRYNINTEKNVVWHNYKLKPSQSENFDLYFSIHDNHVGLFTIGGFTKRIQGLIFSTTRQIIDPAEYELEASTKNKEAYTTINDPEDAKVWGIEIDWQTHFWYLPGFLKGFVFNANYTHIFSEAKYPRTEVEIDWSSYPVQKNYIYSYYTARLLHQPNYILNAAIGYDYKDFSGRLSMLYQSDIFMGANYWPELRKITDDYLRWDISLKQDLPVEGLQIFCNLNNITGAFDKDINAGTLYPTAVQHYGMTIDLGFRWRY